MLLSDYITQIRVLVHDLSKNDWTDQELTTIVNAARQRVALDLHCVRSFVGGPAVLAGAPASQITLVTNQEVYPINSGIPGAVITSSGSGYVSAPSVTFSAPPAGGIAATGVAVLNAAGGVASITMTNWGNGYVVSAPPIITFGSGAATASPITFFNVLDIVSISYVQPGSTYRQMLKWLSFSLFQAWLRMYSITTGPPAAWTTHEGSNRIYIFPVPDQAYVVEFDIVTMPTDLALLTDTDGQVLQPYSDCVQYYGAFLARSKLQDFEKADYFRKLYNTRAKEVNATRQSRRIPSPYMSSARRMSRW